MTAIELIIPGDPVPWARAREHRTGRIVRRYTQPAQAAHAARVLAIARAVAVVPPWQACAPLSVEIETWHARHLRRPRWLPVGVWRTGAGYWRPTKPDADNLGKQVLDGLKGWWHDDAVVVRLLVLDRCVPVGEEPRTVVRISEVGW